MGKAFAMPPAYGLGRTATGTELVLPNIRSPASPNPGTM